MSFALQCVWKHASDALREEAADFWLAEGAVKQRDQALLRGEHLLVIARDRNGKIAALSTAYKEPVHNFGFSLFLFQMFIGKAHRRLGLAQDIMLLAGRELEQRFAAGENRDALGLVVEITNQKAMRVRNETVWRDKGMEWFYFGKSPRGFHLRAWYFDGARIPN